MDYSPSASAPSHHPIHGIGVEDRGRVAHVWLDRPPVNAFNIEMLVQLREVLGVLAADKRPVLLFGTREIFSAGFDIKQAAADVPVADELSRELLASLHDY